MKPLKNKIRILFGLAAVLIVGCALCSVLLPYPSFFIFRHRSREYYSEFAQACNLVLQQHPLGTNQSLSIPVTDPALPKCIRDMKPINIGIGPTGIAILHGGDVEFGISWTRDSDSGRSNVWVLTTTCESHTRVLYTHAQ